MSPAGPLPDPPRRRRWLWIVLGILGACVLVCGFLFVGANTFWSDELRDFATRAAEFTPEPGD